MRVRYGDEKDEYALIDDIGHAQERIGGSSIDRYLEWKNVRGLAAELVLPRNLLCNRHVGFEGSYVVIETGRGQHRESRIRPRERVEREKR